MFRYFLWVQLAAITFLTCDSRLKKDDAPFEPLPTATLAVIDSIVLKQDSTLFRSFSFDNYEEGYFIGINQSNEVFLFDRDGAISSRIGRKGNGPGEYQLPVGVTSIARDSIFVADYTSGKIQLYSAEGNYLASWDVIRGDPQNTFTIFYNYLHVERNKDGGFVFEYLGRSDKLNNITTPRYYKQAKLLSKFSTTTKVYQHYVPFEQDSPYLLDQYFLSPLDPRVIKLPNRMYGVVFAHEDCIYIYDEVGGLKQRIEGRSQFFPLAKGVSFDKKDAQFGVDYVKYNIKQNALNYQSLNSFVKADGGIVVAKQYEAPVNDETLPNDLNTLKFTYFKRDSYLQFYDLEGRKLFEDIKQPYELRNLVYARGFDFLIFRADPKLVERNVLYVAKVLQ